MVRVMALCVIGLTSCPAALAQDFVLREHLGRTWSHEFVTFPLTPTQVKAVQQGAQVVGPDKEVVPSQLFTENGQTRLAFQVTLLPGATQSYRLDSTAKAIAGNLQVEDKQDRWQLGNEHIGIALRKQLKGNEAPIAGVRVRSGGWTAGATRTGGADIASYSALVTARGP
ncbi:MAG: hypothetical protein FJ303_08240, partial [Planctomycetes bacterium]|nr:hypothetical protein [Planctomycetota bacterium]